MTAINYVRNVGGGGVVVAHGCRSQALPLTGVEVWPRLGPAGLALAFTHIAVELLNFACNSPTTLSNYEFTTLELQRFQTLLKLHSIELHATFLGGRLPTPPRAPQPGLVGEVARLSETGGNFVRVYLRRIETPVAFAGQ